MAGILVTQDGLVCGDAPVDSKGVVKDADATVGLGMVELIALVLEDCCLAQYGKTMGKALGDEELTMVVLCQLHGDMLAVGGTALADIYCDIKDGSPDTAHEFALGERGTLEMEAAHDAVGGHGFVVLDEGDGMTKEGGYFLIELPLGEALEEVSSIVTEDLGL